MWLNCCNLMIKPLMEAQLLPMNEQRMWFLEMKTTPDEDAMK